MNFFRDQTEAVASRDLKQVAPRRRPFPQQDNLERGAPNSYLSIVHPLQHSEFPWILGWNVCATIPKDVLGKGFEGLHPGPVVERRRNRIARLRIL